MVLNDSNLTFKIANSQEILEFQRLLFHVYCLTLKWHEPEKFPDKIFVDEYDHNSIFLTVYYGEKLISGIRLVKDSVQGFPHEKTSHITLPSIQNEAVDEKIRILLQQTNRSKIMEMTRFISVAGNNRISTYDILKAAYWFAILNGIEIFFMLVDMDLFLLSWKLKINLIPIGIPVFCEGSWSIPTVTIVKNIPLSFPDHVKDYFLNKSQLHGMW
jgi:hypothetical protein